MIIGIIFFSILAGLGLLIFIKRVNRSPWPEVKGSIIGFKEFFRWASPQRDYGPSKVYYIPMIQYVVNGKEYAGEPEVSLAWNKPDFAKSITVCYNPQKPEDFYLNDNTMLGGCILMALGAIAIIIILLYNL